MTEREKSMLVSMISNGVEFRKDMAELNGKTYCIEEINRVAEIGWEIIEKATPKKPIDIQKSVVKWGLCPNCKGELNKLGSRPNRVFVNAKYCSDCGQAIDWSEENGNE